VLYQLTQYLSQATEIALSPQFELNMRSFLSPHLVAVLIFHVSSNYSATNIGETNVGPLVQQK
jgi:hypothetical protein